jgi:hypothetical protein
MKNAHLRFGKLACVRGTEKTATNIGVLLDAFIGEERGKAHLASVMGGDVEIGALSAAFPNGDSFTAIDPSALRVHRLPGREIALLPRIYQGEHEGETIIRKRVGILPKAISDFL